jgi:hypothetical protein
MTNVALNTMHRLRLFWITLLLPLLVGCGDGRPARVNVSGQVLIDGKPLTCGYVRLIPPSDRPSVSRIGPDGRFVLDCFEEEDGAVLGTHKVAIIGLEVLDSTRQRWHAPKKYASAETSGLTATIDGSTETLDFKLTWDGGEPFIENVAGGE